jgi:hypothetical protein
MNEETISFIKKKTKKQGKEINTLRKKVVKYDEMELIMKQLREENEILKKNQQPFNNNNIKEE